MQLNKRHLQLGPASREGLEGSRRGNSARDECYFIKIKKRNSKSPSVANNPYYPFQPFEVAKLAGVFDKWVG